MKIPSMAAVWRAGYARPFLILLAVNLLFLPLTFMRSLDERRLSVKAVALRQIIAEQRKTADEVRSQVKTVSSNVADVKRFYEEVIRPRREELSPTLQRLVSLATDLGIRTPSLNWAPEQIKGANLTKVEISMPVSGTYQQLGGLLQKLERSPDFVIVKQVAMQGRVSDGGAELDIRIEAYFQGEKP